MPKLRGLLVIAAALAACDSPAPTDAKTSDAKASDAKASDAKASDAKASDAKASDAKASDAKASDAKASDAKAEGPEPTMPTTALPTGDDTAIPTPPVAGEVAIKAWASTAHTAAWTEKTAPSEPIAFSAQVYAGVVGKSGAGWFHVDATGELVPVAMDPAPNAEILGVWPSDAWMVQTRMKEDAGFSYQELRLMKLRGGNRWVPQTYGSNEQWFHPGTGTDDSGRAEYDDPHMSTRSGMLMYAETFEDITRVAGKHDDPILGPHRGRPVDFFETGAGKIYLVSYGDGSYWVQTECADEACVAANSVKLPLSTWSFGRRVSRGKHSISALATSGVREFILHHRGKSDGWLLEELPAGERPSSMWDSEEGGLWSLHGETLRWRDTESAWHDVALPPGMTKPSVALSTDRKSVWVAGDVAGAPKVFTTPANAPK